MSVIIDKDTISIRSLINVRLNVKRLNIEFKVIGHSL